MKKEEKEAIEIINNSYDYNTGYVECEVEVWNIIVNYIDKLQKENEELKEQRDNAIKLRNELIEEQKITCVSKNKIREIVEKSYNDIDYFNRDIRKDLENLLGE